VLQCPEARPPAIAEAAALGSLSPREPLPAQFISVFVAFAGLDTIQSGVASPVIARSNTQPDEACHRPHEGRRVMNPYYTAFGRLFVRVVLASAVLLAPVQAAESNDRWEGLIVAKELTDCPDEYDRADYKYHRPTLLPLLKNMTAGAIFAPYTRRVFDSDGDVEVEHIVAAKQAHLSGLCKEDKETRSAFASDLLNLTLAAAGLNQAKDECDAASWIPPENRCWFTRRVIAVRLKYRLTIDQDEVDALESILERCTPKDECMNISVKPGAPALEKWDLNDNGRITCDELREKGVRTPINNSHPAWPFVKDKHCDGVACS